MIAVRRGIGAAAASPPISFGSGQQIRKWKWISQAKNLKFSKAETCYKVVFLLLIDIELLNTIQSNHWEFA